MFRFTLWQEFEIGLAIESHYREASPWHVVDIESSQYFIGWRKTWSRPGATCRPFVALGITQYAKEQVTTTQPGVPVLDPYVELQEGVSFYLRSGTNWQASWGGYLGVEVRVSGVTDGVGAGVIAGYSW